jgi:anaphase-promoting complex subunit 2
MTAAIMARAPPSFSSSFQPLFRASLGARQAKWEENQEMECGNNDDDDDEDETSLFHSLQTLGWVRRGGGGSASLAEQPLGQALHHAILLQVKKTIQGEFEQDTLHPLVIEWKDAVVHPWVQDLVGPAAFVEEHWASRLAFSVAECFCLVRMDELFDIIADYPESHPSVVELRQTLAQTAMHAQLGQALQKSLVQRLMHPGANTSQIIDMYINTIKVLREIDPSDRLLDVVTDPVRTYLRGRSDTVRCIITR